MYWSRYIEHRHKHEIPTGTETILGIIPNALIVTEILSLLKFKNVNTNSSEDKTDSEFGDAI